MKMVHGQALAEQQAAILLAALLCVAGVGGAFWWYQSGQLNLPRDISRQFDDARAMAQAGTLNVQITSTNNQTTVVFDTGADPTGGRTIRANTFQGTPNFVSGSQSWNGAITFIVAPDGVAQVYGSGACPSDLALKLSNKSYAVSCDPFSMSGA